MKKILVVPDTHVPYHDKRAFNLVLKSAKYYGTDIVVVLGDFLDCYTVSDYDKSPTRKKTLKNEVEEAITGLAELKKVGRYKSIFISGNHEFRLERYVIKKAKELYDLISMPELLKLDKTGWEYYPYMDYAKIGKMFFTHDLGLGGKTAVLRTVEVAGHNIGFGHTHRAGIGYLNNPFGEAHVAVNYGWLGDVQYLDYAHKLKAKRESQLAFGFSVWDEKTDIVYNQLIPIIDYSVCIEGKVIRG